MQIASFILVNDRTLRRFEDQLETVLRDVPSPNVAFVNLVPMRLQELGIEHPISIPFSTLFPMDQIAERQHERLLSAFEDPRRPSKLAKMAEEARTPIYYVAPGRVLDFARELERLRLVAHVHPQDVENLLGHQITHADIPAATHLLDQYRHDLYQVYRDAAEEGKGVVVLVVSQPDDLTSEQGFPRAA